MRNARCYAYYAYFFNAILWQNKCSLDWPHTEEAKGGQSRGSEHNNHIQVKNFPIVANFYGETAAAKVHGYLWRRSSASAG